MKQTIIFDRDKGGHFLDWSIYYLSGQTEYLHCLSRQVLKVTNNPLTSLNSHVHKGNFAGTISELEKIYSFENCNVAFHQMRPNDRSFDKSYCQTTKAIELAKQKSDHVIVLKNHKDFMLYDFSYRRRSKNVSYDGKSMLTNNQDFFDHFVDTFFAESKASWKDAGNFEHIWDQREFIALNFKPFENQSIELHHDLKFEHFSLNTKQFWFDFDPTNLLNYLNLSIKNLEEWKLIYNQWINIHNQKINFCKYFNEIVDSIIQNRNMDLLCFNLDLLQEAAIQHALIYQYNLNLKTWQLDCFKNTKQLYNLLELNIHEL